MSVLIKSQAIFQFFGILFWLTQRRVHDKETETCAYDKETGTCVYDKETETCVYNKAIFNLTSNILKLAQLR